MLGEGQGLQGSVKGPSGLGHLALVHQELAVVQPDPGHLEGEEEEEEEEEEGREG